MDFKLFNIFIVILLILQIKANHQLVDDYFIARNNYLSYIVEKQILQREILKGIIHEYMYN